jgi:lipoate synthase
MLLGSVVGMEMSLMRIWECLIFRSKHNSVKYGVNKKKPSDVKNRRSYKDKLTEVKGRAMDHFLMTICQEYEPSLCNLPNCLVAQTPLIQIYEEVCRFVKSTASPRCTRREIPI